MLKDEDEKKEMMKKKCLVKRYSKFTVHEMVYERVTREKRVTNDRGRKIETIMTFSFK